jgi:hypothetical protein
MQDSQLNFAAVDRGRWLLPYRLYAAAICKMHGGRRFGSRLTDGTPKGGCLMEAGWVMAIQIGSTE